MTNKRLAFVKVPIFLAGLAILTLLAIVNYQSSLASPGILYVAPGGACGSASPCYSSVQAAVNAAQAGDEIRVASGTYTGMSNQGGHPQHVYIAKSLTIKGGYTTSNWTTPKPAMNKTELQAQTLGRVVYITGADTVVTLQGLHITYGSSDGLGGHESGIYPHAGGGIYVDQSSLTLKDSWLTNNASPSNGAGGGLYIREGTLNISATTLAENEAGSGAAIYLHVTQSLIESNSIFENNRSTALGGGPAVKASGGEFTMLDSRIETTASFSGDGGGLSLSESEILVENNVISGTRVGNAVTLAGSNGTLRGNLISSNKHIGVQIGDGTYTLVDNEIAYNQGLGGTIGGGVSIDALLALDVTLVGNFIHHNIDEYSACQGGGVYIDARVGSITLLNNIIQDNMAGELDGIPSHGYGGGVYIVGDNATLDGNLIQNNTAVGFIWAGTQVWGGHGGGVYIKGKPTLKNNVITGNAARFKCSGIYIAGSAPSLYHNTIAQNAHGSDEASGIYVVEASSTERSQPRLYNTIIVNQTVGIYAKGDVIKNIVTVDGILWSDNISNTWGSGTFFLSNQTTGDPAFLDAAGDDYHITAGSPAIDKGSVAGVLFDIDGEPRTGLPDLGADEYWLPGILRRIYLPAVLRDFLSP